MSHIRVSSSSLTLPALQNLVAGAAPHLTAVPLWVHLHSTAAPAKLAGHRTLGVTAAGVVMATAGVPPGSEAAPAVEAEEGDTAEVVAGRINVALAGL